MLKKIGGVLAILIASMGLVFASTGPAAADVADNNQVNFWNDANWVGQWYHEDVTNFACQSLGGSTMDNAATSLRNWENFQIRVYDTYNCSGSYLQFGANSGANNLAGLNFNNKISSFIRW